jgi:REP element-mobilizing transposase RayT
MARPRSTLISLETTPYYHCISRCVRRCFLFGRDSLTGRDFNHRKPWLLQRLKLLAEVFAIDIPAYAIMSNHYHLVLHVDKAKADAWTQEEVITRWLRLHRGPELIQRHVLGEALHEHEQQVLHDTVEYWRERLTSISCFMARLNYFIALHANKEDKCTGRFWEGRFKSQALVDIAALLSCMAYVDLNPVRAGIAEDLESSDFTSIQDRIRQLQGEPRKEGPALMAFGEAEREGQSQAMLPFGLKDYLELAYWSGRALRADKRGYIRPHTPKLLSQLGLSERDWQILAAETGRESISMFHGLNKLAVVERRKPVTKVA